MSNHFHLVLKLCSEQAETWTDAEVIQRWTSLYKGPLLVQKWQAGDALIQAEQQAVSDCIIIYRQRLGSLSWFMKCLNEPIAREANKEDGCTGHFWESRFKSQALLNEESLLSCMAYVDLNPIRAKMANTPEDSDHTSIQERIAPQFNLADAIRQQIEQQCLRHFELPLKPLTYFEGNITDKEQTGVLFSAQDYIQLVDYTWRIIRPDKRGAISAHLPSILHRLNLDEKSWLNNATQFEQTFYRKFARKRQHLADTS